MSDDPAMAVHVTKRAFADRWADFPKVLEMHLRTIADSTIDDPVTGAAACIEMAAIILRPELKVTVEVRRAET